MELSGVFRNDSTPISFSCEERRHKMVLWIRLSKFRPCICAVLVDYEHLGTKINLEVMGEF